MVDGELTEAGREKLRDILKTPSTAVPTILLERGWVEPKVVPYVFNQNVSLVIFKVSAAGREALGLSPIEA